MITEQTRDSSGAQQVSGPYGNKTSDIVLHSAGGQGPEAFVLREISSTIFPQQTLALPPNSFLIEMQMHLSGWLHFP